MKKVGFMAASVALASLGIGALAYTYAQKHPIKTKALAADVKSMMKDLK